jgi:hypothetical protein
LQVVCDMAQPAKPWNICICIASCMRLGRD